MNQQLPPLKKPKTEKLKPLPGNGSVGPILAGIGIAVVGLVIAAGLILFLLSNQDESDPGITIPVGDGKSSTGSSESGGESSFSAPPNQLAKSLPRRTEYIAYAWTARLPVGPGWTSPETSQLGDLERTEIRGPDGAIIIVDWTPSAAPDPLNEVGARVPAGFPDKPGAEYVAIEGGSVCPAGTTCTDYLIPFGSGGYAVLVGWPDKEGKAARLARAIARSLSPIAG